MQIIVKDSLIKYAVDDSDIIVIGTEKSTVVSETGIPLYIINDINQSNSSTMIVESLPEDFVGDKYMLVAGDIMPNLDCVEPEESEE